jgi:hypothetical protein
VARLTAEARVELKSKMSFRDGPKDQTSDAQLRIEESRDSGFALMRAPE